MAELMNSTSCPIPSSTVFLNDGEQQFSAGKLLSNFTLSLDIDLQEVASLILIAKLGLTRINQVCCAKSGSWESQA